MGRSGTTLLQALLSAHSRIAIAPESHFMKNASLFGGVGSGGPADFDAFWANYVRTVNFQDLGVSADACVARIRGAPDRSYGSIFSAILSVYAEKAEKPRVGDKTPNHVHFLDELLHWFPHAQVLVLRRDPRSVVASQLRSPWVTLRLGPISPRHGLFARKRSSELGRFAREWVRTYERTVSRWEADPRVLVVSYEELVTDVEGALRSVCSFLDERFEPGMITSRSRETVPRPEAELNDERWQGWREKHVEKSLGPVDRSKVEKWKESLSRMEAAAVEGWCRRPMLAAGYAPASPTWLRLVSSVWFRGVHAAARVEERARSLAKRLLRNPSS